MHRPSVSDVGNKNTMGKDKGNEREHIHLTGRSIRFFPRFYFTLRTVIFYCVLRYTDQIQVKLLNNKLINGNKYYKCNLKCYYIFNNNKNRNLMINLIMVEKKKMMWETKNKINTIFVIF